jgi:uncharacterized protein YjfI (DUF2170 family)
MSTRRILKIIWYDHERDCTEWKDTDDFKRSLAKYTVTPITSVGIAVVEHDDYIVLVSHISEEEVLFELTLMRGEIESLESLGEVDLPFLDP